MIVGDGKLRGRIEADARTPGSTCVAGWQPRPEALAWMRHAAALVFPSRGPESLSRVLLEAGALGVPIAAMDTGGTRDIIEHERTGLLSSTAEGWRRISAGCSAIRRWRPARRRSARARHLHVRCVGRCLENRSVMQDVMASQRSGADRG